VRTCAITLDLAAIPTWRPSPNDETKRRIADELRREIEAQWHGVQEIVVRDFNLKDGLIKMYLKLPDGDYYESCGFHAMSQAPLRQLGGLRIVTAFRRSTADFRQAIPA